VKNFHIYNFFEIRSRLTPDPRGFLFRMSGFSLKSYTSKTTAFRKLALA